MAGAEMRAHFVTNCVHGDADAAMKLHGIAIVTPWSTEILSKRHVAGFGQVVCGETTTKGENGATTSGIRAKEF